MIDRSFTGIGHVPSMIRDALASILILFASAPTMAQKAGSPHLTVDESAYLDDIVVTGIAPTVPTAELAIAAMVSSPPASLDEATAGLVTGTTGTSGMVADPDRVEAEYARTARILRTDR